MGWRTPVKAGDCCAPFSGSPSLLSPIPSLLPWYVPLVALEGRDCPHAADGEGRGQVVSPRWGIVPESHGGLVQPPALPSQRVVVQAAVDQARQCQGHYHSLVEGRQGRAPCFQHKRGTEETR